MHDILDTILICVGAIWVQLRAQDESFICVGSWPVAWRFPRDQSKNPYHDYLHLTCGTALFRGALANFTPRRRDKVAFMASLRAALAAGAAEGISASSASTGPALQPSTGPALQPLREALDALGAMDA